jgi:hypothetical protein
MNFLMKGERPIWADSELQLRNVYNSFKTTLNWRWALWSLGPTSYSDLARMCLISPHNQTGDPIPGKRETRASCLCQGSIEIRKGFLGFLGFLEVLKSQGVTSPPHPASAWTWIIWDGETPNWSAENKAEDCMARSHLELWRNWTHTRGHHYLWCYSGVNRHFAFTYSECLFCPQRRNSTTQAAPSPASREREVKSYKVLVASCLKGKKSAVFLLCSSPPLMI